MRRAKVIFIGRKILGEEEKRIDILKFEAAQTLRGALSKGVVDAWSQKEAIAGEKVHKELPRSSSTGKLLFRQ